MAARFGGPADSWRLRAYTIIFESDTGAGRGFDRLLIAAILTSVAVVVLDSEHSITARYGTLFDVLEWGFRLLFTVEYVLRLACVRQPLRHATSFFGIVDLLAVLMASRRKIIVFVGFVLVTVTVLGTVMYVVEGPRNGFTSIPVSIYWGITTMTTVGFGDITPTRGSASTAASRCRNTRRTERSAEGRSRGPCFTLGTAPPHRCRASWQRRRRARAPQARGRCCH